MGSIGQSSLGILAGARATVALKAHLPPTLDPLIARLSAGTPALFLSPAVAGPRRPPARPPSFSPRLPLASRRPPPPRLPDLAGAGRWRSDTTGRWPRRPSGSASSWCSSAVTSIFPPARRSPPPSRPSAAVSNCSLASLPLQTPAPHVNDVALIGPLCMLQWQKDTGWSKRPCPPIPVGCLLAPPLLALLTLSLHLSQHTFEAAILVLLGRIEQFPNV
jgi:hypothetical protein